MICSLMWPGWAPQQGLTQRAHCVRPFSVLRSGYKAHQQPILARIDVDICPIVAYNILVRWLGPEGQAGFVTIVRGLILYFFCGG